MKPVSRRALSSTNLNNFNIAIPKLIATIKGSVKKLGSRYSDATVVLYNKADLLPIAIRKPDANGNYQFLGLNSDLTCMAICIPADTDFNALIIDRIVPA